MCENTGLSLLLVRFSRVMIGQTESCDPIFAQQTLAPSDGEKSLAMAHSGWHSKVAGVRFTNFRHSWKVHVNKCQNQNDVKSEFKI